MMNLKDGEIRVPVPLRSDAYTSASDCLVSDYARDGSVYNFTNRYSPEKAWPNVARDSRMVFWGLSNYIRRELTDICTSDDVKEAVEFMARANSFGGPLKFNPKPWEQIVENGGYLPIRIQAVREGAVFFPFEPVIQVTGADGFGEIAAHIEPLLVGAVSISIARATLTRHLLERMIDWVKRDTPDVIDSYAVAQFMIHDFGMRASSSDRESVDLGMAHLLSFNGTDTFNAAYVAWKLGCADSTGTSILALAHRIVQGYDSEQECFDNLAKQDKIGSYVADCYNFKKAVREKLTKLVGDTIVVARPDSGEYIENDMLVLQTAVENGQYTTRPDGVLVPKNLRVIQGDSMTPNKIELLFGNRASRGFSATAWGIIGIGGYLRNSCTRDSLSSAYKLSAVRKNFGWSPVVKLSEVKSKLSVPGPVVIRRKKNDAGDYEAIESVLFESECKWFGENELVTYYNDGVFADDETFKTKQTRTISDFNAAAKLPKDYGLFRNNLSLSIRDIQDRVYQEHQK
jgi:nicotinamide phosphoribosyltransferase